MGIPMFDLTKKPTRHSYSSISLYQRCPAAYGYRYIQKMPDPPTAAMMRGTRFHKMAEDYMNADFSESVPYDIRKVGLKLYQLRGQYAKPEATWLLDRDWKPTEDKDGAMLIAVIDVHLINGDTLKLHDYKSGREYPSHADQLELYATIGLCVYPDIKRAESSAIYFDTGHESSQRSIIRDMLPYYRDKWSGYVARIDGDADFRPTAGGHCQRCAFASTAGGPCDEWRNA
jgi:PD-(D/E)XK nuclease superfamily